MAVTEARSQDVVPMYELTDPNFYNTNIRFWVSRTPSAPEIMCARDVCRFHIICVQAGEWQWVGKLEGEQYGSIQ